MRGELIQAKCPHCATGCTRCTNGYVQLRIANSRYFYARKCTNPHCGQTNGGRMSDEVLQGGTATPCPWCNWPSSWLLVDDRDAKKENG